MREFYKLNKDIFIERSNKVHNNKYDYSKVEYINQRTKVIITCPIHGDFEQTPKNHMNGQGCPICGAEYAKNYKKNNYTNFIEESYKRFGEEYEFPNIVNEYENSHSKITIKHKKCGREFIKIACDHITSSNGGCPCINCNSSIEEKNMLSYIESIIDGNIKTNDRSTLDNNEIDILIDELKLGFEYNGLFWHNELHKDKFYHLNKLNECLSKNIKLIQFFEDEWLYKTNIVKSMINNFLHKSFIKIYARKCIIKEVTYKETNDFLVENHLQGNCSSKYRYGLYYNNELVSLMTFGSLRKNLGSSSKEGCYELLRFCNKLNTNVIGGASKLFKHFIKEHNPSEIISYCDRRWSQGNMYNMLGFELDHVSPPSYFYHIKDKRINRFSFRKSELIKKYNCPKEKTEKEFCFEQKWYRIYDCGCLCFKWKK